MRNKPLLFYAIVSFVVLLVGALVVLFVRDGVYFYRLQALDSQSETALGTITYREERSIDYVFEVNGKEYSGAAQANGFAIEELTVRYFPGDPNANIPATSDLPAERSFALMRMGIIAGFVTIGTVAFVILRRR
jgi:hypothetical protein